MGRSLVRRGGRVKNPTQSSRLTKGNINSTRRGSLRPERSGSPCGIRTKPPTRFRGNNYGYFYGLTRPTPHAAVGCGWNGVCYLVFRNAGLAGSDSAYLLLVGSIIVKEQHSEKAIK
jgi:hypothetical protein